MKILLADDDKIERTALRELFNGHSNLEILEVEDGQAALDTLCDGLKPDLCIFDIRMPKVDGIELLQRMRRDPSLRGLKVVMTSATRDRETILTLAKLKIAGYLLKPYDFAKTRAVLQPLLTATASANPLLVSRNLLGKTALIADGDITSRSTLESMIRAEPGWEIATAADGQSALNLLQRGLRPDVIIVDLLMPQLDGVSFVNRVRSDPHLRALKIAVISATQDREKIVALAALGVRTVLTKPLDQAKVSALLRGGDAPAEEKEPASASSSRSAPST